MTASDVAVIKEMLKGLCEDLGEVKALAAATNGRVRRLEEWRAGIAGEIRGARRAIGAIPVFVATLAGVGSIIAIVIALAR